MKNKYLRNSKLSEYFFLKILKYFCLDLTVSQISQITFFHRSSINRLIQKLRIKIYELSLKENPLFNGEVECDESYFGARRVRGLRGRGASGKIKVFGLLKRGGKVYTQIVDDVSAKTLLPIIRGKVAPETIIHTDGWKSYNGLVDLGYKKHYRVLHSNNEFKNDKSHINGIESFWSFAKLRLTKFNGIKSKYFDLHLKESEWRFNYRKINIYNILKDEFKKNK